MSKKIKCSRCIKAPVIELKNPIFLKDEHTEYCPNCATELAYVDGDNFMPKYNLWAIRTRTSTIIKTK